MASEVIPTLFVSAFESVYHSVKQLWHFYANNWHNLQDWLNYVTFSQNVVYVAQVERSPLNTLVIIFFSPFLTDVTTLTTLAS